MRNRARFDTKRWHPFFRPLDSIPRRLAGNFFSCLFIRVDPCYPWFGNSVILNGNHGTTAAMLMAGKPVFQVPIFLEQVLVSSAVTRLGAGLSAGANEPEQVAMGLSEFLRSETYAANARAFAARYADFDPDRQERAIHERIDSLLS